MCGSKPKSAPPPIPVAPQVIPQDADPTVQASRDDERRRRLAAGQGNQTLLTGGAGLIAAAAAPSAQKQLLGA